MRSPDAGQNPAALRGSVGGRPRSPASKHMMIIYELSADGKKVIFTSGELSANVWGVYVPA
jgi:hypothetical protein